MSLAHSLDGPTCALGRPHKARADYLGSAGNPGGPAARRVRPKRRWTPLTRSRRCPGPAQPGRRPSCTADVRDMIKGERRSATPDDAQAAGHPAHDRGGNYRGRAEGRAQPTRTACGTWSTPTNQHQRPTLARSKTQTCQQPRPVSRSGHPRTQRQYGTFNSTRHIETARSAVVRQRA
jgi:hypothetical protein